MRRTPRGSVAHPEASEIVLSDRKEQNLLEQARRFEAAGDECVYANDVHQAKVNYGWAIDSFLEARAYDESIRICRKLIRIAPDVVRTRYTLLFLLVGLGRYSEARPALDDYLRVVQQTGTRSFAIPRLQLLAHATDDPDTIAHIEEILRGLGAEQMGFTLRGSEQAAPPGSPGSESIERWETLLPIALRDD